MTTDRVNVPVPVQDLQCITHRLNDCWVLWYDALDAAEPEEDSIPPVCSENIKQIAIVSTLEEFWCMYCYISRPTALAQCCKYYVFRLTVSPWFEDESNAGGGRFVATFNHDAYQRGSAHDNEAHRINLMWENLLMLLVGEGCSPESGDPPSEGEPVVLGVTAIRPTDFTLKISVWTSESKNVEAVRGLGVKIKSTANIEVPLVYYAHDSADEVMTL